jgi:hypothetical protein
MDSTIQGTLLALAIGALGTGIELVEKTDLLTGVLLVLIGVGIIAWREYRKAPTIVVEPPVAPPVDTTGEGGVIQ